MPVKLTVVFLCIFVFSLGVEAQTTEFVYQGQLQNSSAPANGSFDFELLLFDALSGGNQVGSTLTRSGITVINGVFSVKLDFGANYPGANRFLEIHVRQTGGGAFTPLTPRQQVTSAPYSVKSLNSSSADIATNSAQLGGVAANQYVITTDPRMTDARPPAAGSANYIQNQNGAPQASSNFNISGTGTANVFNAATQFNIGGQRVLSQTGSNLSVGFSSGQSFTTGFNNSFFGQAAGVATSTGDSNSFFGTFSGSGNTTGTNNSFFGLSSGTSNTTGSANTFSGDGSGFSNTTGNFGVYLGFGAGASNTSGNRNIFIGGNSGLANTTGSDNTVIGTLANVGSDNLNFATAIGAGSIVSTSNTVVLGRGTDGVLVPGSLTVTGALNAALPSGSTNYIQNTSAAPASSFQITGNGRADRFSADTSFNIGPARVLSVGADNSGAFVGRNAGNSSSGSYSTFIGQDAGKNTTGGFNTFIGAASGSSQFSTLTGSNNAFLGVNSGLNTSTGSFNTAVGADAGEDTNTGTHNTSLGSMSGKANNTGSNNTAIGSDADFGTSNLSNATAIGSQARVSQSNSLVLGSIAGIGNGTADTNVGIGTAAPNYRLHVVGQEIRLEGNNQPRFSLNFTSGTADAKKWYHRAATDELVFALLNDAENIETPWLRVTRSGMTVTNVSFPAGTVSVTALGSAGSTALCRNASNQISACSSSARYKNNINSFTSGLDLIRRLHPVSFNWRDGGMPDMGLVAEDVNAVEPLLTTLNKDGQVEGVKYDRVGVVLINAVKEQQAQIEAQQKRIEFQQKQIELLTKVVCSMNPKVEICRQ